MIIGDLCFLSFVLHVLCFHMRPVYCPLFFIFVLCAVSVTGHLAVDSAR
jgi:hypothetical protein